jgi:hypothetical protein
VALDVLRRHDDPVGGLRSRFVKRIVRCSENAGCETWVPTPGAAICDGAPPSFAASTVTEAGTDVLTSTVLTMDCTVQPGPAETVPTGRRC